MSKRFTDTDKWKKKFIKSLEAPYKLLWLYILDECDHAGIWIVDFEVAQLRLGENLFESEALEAFSDKIFPIENGEKWLVLDFIEFQYGQLKETNRVHESVINVLRKYHLWHEEEKIIIKNKVFVSPLQGVKDKDKDKEKDKDKDKDKERAKSEILFPFNSDVFLEKWKQWKAYRKEIKKPYRSAMSEQAALKNLSEISETDEFNAIKIIELSIANQWQGLFKLKPNEQTSKTNQTKFGADIDSLIARKYGNAAN